MKLLRRILMLVAVLALAWVALNSLPGRSTPAGASRPALPTQPAPAPAPAPVVEPVAVIPVSLAGAPQAQAGPPPSIAAILEHSNLNDPQERQRAAAAIRAIEVERIKAGVNRAQQLHLPLRLERPDGQVMEIAGVDPTGRPFYRITHNVNAAISTGADLLRLAPYSLKGSGIPIGLWDGGSARTTHQELTGRVTIGETTAPAAIDHATHVAGTLIASGVNTSALGMAPLATVLSYDWTSDISEMTSRGATAPSQADKIYLSNHSYGYIAGWYKTGGTNPAYIWYGSGTTTTSVDPYFGQYSSFSQDSDALAYSAPYYLMFRSAGNDRTDNPTNGQTVQLSTSSTATTTYSSASHPAGDGTYRGGYDTISFDAVAKNVITIGSVADAVSGGVRSLANATMSSFSAWGPTDDGRIKPDVVANGETVFSSIATTNSSYSSYNGTSMATPNAAGTAALLIQQYNTLFPGSAMRSATLKGLLIHTADDLGNTGPDYTYGWGLLNGKAAADLIRDHAAYPLKARINETSLASTTPTTQDFIWDGVSPIRVTLCWTDPAGPTTTDLTPTNPIRRLRNDLNLTVTGPTGSVFLPYVMPYVGSWTQAAMSTPATTGVNNTDNVEQVYIATPGSPGVYRISVSCQGSLYQGNPQPFSLIVSGSTDVAAPPPALAITSVTPTSAFNLGSTTIDLAGSALSGVTQVKLTRAGSTDITASNLQMVGSSLRCTVNLAGATPGAWNVVATSATESATLSNGFTVNSAIFYQNFDATVSGWTTTTTGTNNWALTTASSHTPATSYFVGAPASKLTATLTSPSIVVGSIPNGMQLSFWHSYNTQSGQDGGRLELSIDGGTTWFGVDDANSGAAFTSNGYNTTISATGNTNNRSAFAGKAAWSGNSIGFIQTVVNLTTAKFANKTVRFRWVFATNANTASTGWYVDTISLTSDGDTSNTAPTITSAASAPGRSTLVETVDGVDYTYFVVPDTNTPLSVAASDDGGAANLTYTWVASGPAPVSFSANASNAAATTTASFEKAGDYSLTVTVTDGGGLSTSSTLLVRVSQVNTALRITPSQLTLSVNDSYQFQAAMLDQFNNPMVSQPASFSWSSSGASISGTGLFTATSKGSFSVTASTTIASTTYSKSAQVTANPLTATITLGNLAQTYDGSPKTVTATTAPGTYPVSITYNGSSSAPSDAGSYTVAATVSTSTHEGSAEATLVINKATATVTLGNLTHTYDGNSKSASVTTSPSPLNVTVTYNGSTTLPSAVGTYPVVASVADPNYQGSATGQLTITASFLSWQQAQFSAAQISAGQAAPEADADGDRLTNLAEYALGTNPNSFSPAPVVTLDASYLTLTFTRPKDATDVSYSAESSAAPSGPWSPVTLELIDSTSTTETMRARVLRSLSPNARYLRLDFQR